MFIKISFLLVACVGLSTCVHHKHTNVRAIVTDASDTRVLRRVYSAGTHTWPAPEIAQNTSFIEFAPIAPPQEQSTPNPLSKLGETLFFDPMLSKSGEISCASCHNPGIAFAQHTKVSTGHGKQKGKRNAPTLLGVTTTAPYFVDQRAATLEEQVLFPLQDPIEMATTKEEIEAKINSSRYYRKDFKRTLNTDDISIEDIAIAIASYERTLYAQTKFDRFLNGNTDEFTDKEILGLHLFRTKARCMSCHSGPSLSDGKSHNIGLTYYGRKYEDLGVYNISGRAEDVGAFDTPSLRHLSKTAPYMHNGLFPSLKGIVNIYNAGNPHPRRKVHQIDDPLFPKTSEHLVPLKLTKEEKTALIAFLNTL